MSVLNFYSLYPFINLHIITDIFWMNFIFNPLFEQKISNFKYNYTNFSIHYLSLS